jgi:hypothetical protein
MSSAPLESAVERRVVEWAEAHDWWTIKLMRCNKRGVPDRLFCRRGRVVFIEMKRDGKEPSLQQHIRMAEIRAQQVEVYWCDSAEDAIDCLL